MVQITYDYMISIIPGLDVIYTKTVRELIHGYTDFFLEFYNELSVFGGGFPSNTQYGIAIPYSDGKGDP
jgi:hypothetical protein